MPSKIFNVPFALSGDKEVIPDALQPDGSVSFTQGFGFDYERPNTDPLYKPFPRDPYNWLMGAMTEAIGEIQKQGVASWSADGAPYQTNAMVRHNGVNWRSNIDANSTEPGVAPLANWSEGRALETGRLLNVKYISASGTYTPTPGTTSIIVEGVGGGGAGGGTGNAGAGNVRAGGGGSSGAFGRKRITAVPGSVAVTVGAGGVGVTADGGAGGATSFGALMSLPGGKGGILGIIVSGAAVSGIGGDLSGNPVGSDMGFSGNHGGPGFALSATSAVGGQGGSTPYGANGQFLAATSTTGTPFSIAGLNGSGYGAGGGGAVCGVGGTGIKGGDGQRGIIVVWEFS